MKYIVDGDIVLSQPLKGPLAAQIGAFAEWAREQGYARYSRYRKILLAACFSGWLERRATRLRRVSSTHASRYLRVRARRVKVHREDVSALKQLLTFLRRQGAIPAERITRRRHTPADQAAQAFEHYLLHERALVRATVVHYLPFIRRFLTDRFGRGPIRLSRLRARDVVRFVQRQAPRLHLKQAKLLTTALRSFRHYARYRGDITLELAAAIPPVANWSMPSIPRAIPAESVRQLLAAIDRRTATGRRDYAILLLLARLGLRASEVAFLDLDDLDWQAGQITVRGKRGVRAALPLPTDVGAAIAAYLRHGRPCSPSRRVFLRAHAPNGGLTGPSAIACVVRRALGRTGVNAPTKGAHQFRYALATEMLRPVVPRPRRPTPRWISGRYGHSRCHGREVRDDRATISRPAVPRGPAELGVSAARCRHVVTQVRRVHGAAPGFRHHDPARARVGATTPDRATDRMGPPAEPCADLCAVSPGDRSPYPDSAGRLAAVSSQTGAPPYLYSDDEIRRLLHAAHTLPANAGFRPWTYHALFGLLSVSGLRLGEARNLCVEDIDLDAGVLTIRGAKFGKSRLVPLHASTRKVLAGYLARRRHHWAGRPVSSYVFVSNWGNRLDVGSIHRTFYALSRQIGLRAPFARHGPRIHDLRHRFAVKTLWRWYRTGEDPERRLPILSAYLGHVHVRDTYWYLSAWPGLMREAMRRLERRWEDQP